MTIDSLKNEGKDMSTQVQPDHTVGDHNKMNVWTKCIRK
jgi:hypothetical protein